MSTTKLPTHRIVHQFEQATVIYTCEHSRATGKAMPKLYVQALDAYGYQRELTVGFRHEPGDAKNLSWESHVYQHPGRREITKLGASQAKRFIGRFLEQCEKYPSLLFNATGEHATNKTRPRSEGFIRLCEALHRGSEPSVKLL